MYSETLNIIYISEKRDIRRSYQFLNCLIPSELFMYENNDTERESGFKPEPVMGETA